MTTRCAVTGSTAGCISATVYPVVEVFESPMVDLGADIQLSAGQDTILDATGPNLTYIYLWSTGETIPAILVNAGGLYSVTVTNLEGCSGFDTIEVTIVTSTFSPVTLNDIKIAPNPTHDNLYIQCRGSSTTFVQVFDNLGRLILSDHSMASIGATRTIDLRKQEAGMYFIRVVGTGWTTTFPVIKY